MHQANRYAISATLFLIASFFSFSSRGDMRSDVSLSLNNTDASLDHIDGDCERNGAVMNCRFHRSIILPADTEEKIRAKIDKAVAGWMQDARENKH